MVWHAAGQELCRRAETQYQMSAPSTEVRVARFLLDFGERQRQLGHSGRQLNLHMSRRDIASCLGVAHESVSRALATLVDAGCIHVHMREIEIVDADALRALQRVTRGAPRSRALRHAQVHAHPLAA
jgi:CRP/FNR family transcriptional regulator